MTDYGHELRFGTFITPSSARVAEVVRLARLSDRLGYELITFQDHEGGKTLFNSTKLLVEAADVTLPEASTHFRLLPGVLAGFRSRREIALENLVLRHQLHVALRTNATPRLRNPDRILWVWFRQLWPSWRDL